jgi:ankyrin repeat protein
MKDRTAEATQRSARVELKDPFSDLKTAFEPPREKLKTFNLKQIVTRNGTVLMNMLERLLETTEIDARDVETDQTLLEFACHTGNMGLAKLCYRRGANLSAKTGTGETAFNIVTKNRRYDLMEFLHTYGVKVNTADARGTTALHTAAANDDVDGVCRLLEWGADVNIKDLKKRTPIHVAAAGGKMKTTMLLLEVGADMNAKDEKEYTAVAHAESNNHFQLMDRLVSLGGRGHGMNQKSTDLARSKSAKMIGELVIGAGCLKSSSLGRIGKVAVPNMPGPIMPSLSEDKGKK